MALIDDVMKLHGQGIGDADIAQKMKEEGYNPRDIDDTISQSKIKSAVNEDSVQSSVIGNYSPASDMQASVMGSEQKQEQAPPQVPQPSEQAPQAEQYAYPEYPQYPAQDVYQGSGGSMEMISEISEQIVSEKLSELRKSLGNLVEFKALMDSRVSGIDERLRRIEIIIDRLQTSVLGKMGNYGQAVEDIKSELGMMQDSFSKVLNPLVNRSREAMKSAPKPEKRDKEEKDETPRSETKVRKAPDFGDYMRS